jgi:hypothetical protein
MAEINISITIPTEQISQFLSDIAGLMEKHKIAEITAKESSAALHERLPGEFVPVLRDHFARAKDGTVPTVPPKDAELQIVKIVRATLSGNKDFLRVISGGGAANCFDSNLFPLIVEGREVGLYLLRSRSGKYTNIVGVRA